VAAVTLAGSAPSASALGALASGYALRNGVVTTASVTSVETWYARLSIAWRVEADERREGLVHVTVAASDGALAAEAFDRRCVPAGAEVEPAQPPSVDHVQVGARFARAAAFPVGSAIAPLLVLTARRQARDHERIAGYYGALLQEVLRPRRKIDPAAAVAKIAHLVSERDRRLADLAQRYTARVSFRLAGVLWVRANAGQVTLLARRRKGQRELRLRVPSGTRVFDRLACEGCDGWADRPALCDGQLHILCERCVPVADGRPVCGGCRGRGTV
jgi:hypothetical protein